MIISGFDGICLTSTCLQGLFLDENTFFWLCGYKACVAGITSKYLLQFFRHGQYIPTDGPTGVLPEGDPGMIIMVDHQVAFLDTSFRKCVQAALQQAFTDSLFVKILLNGEVVDVSAPAVIPA